MGCAGHFDFEIIALPQKGVVFAQRDVELQRPVDVDPGERGGVRHDDGVIFRQQKLDAQRGAVLPEQGDVLAF